MRVILPVVALMGCCGFASGAESDEIPADDRKKFVEFTSKVVANLVGLKDKLKSAEDLLAAAKVGVVDPGVKKVVIPDKIDKAHPIKFPSAKVKNEQIAELREQAKDLRNMVERNVVSSPADAVNPLTLTKAGEFGRFSAMRVRVSEIIDKKAALIATRTDKPGGERNDDVVILVNGIDTSKWADDAAVDAPGGIWYVGTKKIKGKTYFSLTQFIPTKEETEEIMKAVKP